MWVVIVAFFGPVLSACSADERQAQATALVREPVPTLMPSPTGRPLLAPGQPTPLPTDTGWLAAAPGVEVRRLRVEVGGVDSPLSVVRLDPTKVRFEVGYAPDAPKALSTWVNETQAVAAINGGFFDVAGQTVSLLVHDGEAIGESYIGRGGMFATTPDGSIWLRSLADTPYETGEPVAEAVQGWPLLVRARGEAAYSFEDGERDRRSAVAVDAAGRVLLVVASTPAFTLREFAEWLATTDLDVAAAVNLDGGSSSGLIVRSQFNPERIDPFAPLPIVLFAVPR